MFELVHIDLWGPYRHCTNGSCTMFLTIVDDRSKATWVYLLSDKAHVVKLFTAFMQYVETQFSTNIKTVRSDNGSEFLNKAMASCFAEKGIIHQTSCVYTPQ